MTALRRDNHSTEFGLWLRERPEIDSKLGYTTSNLDYIWSNYKTGLWMLIEEKRFNHDPERWQRKLFGLIDLVARLDKNYRGFHLLKFERTSPDDGMIWLNHQKITRDELIKFLQFEYKPQGYDLVKG